MFRIFTPDLWVESVLELPPARLNQMGIRALLLDIDCTLKNYRAEEVRPEVAAWIEQTQTAGVGLCLVSNGRSQRIRRFAEKLRLPFVCQACKPLPRGCRQAMKTMGFDPHSTAMVGDQVFADVMAGKLAGLRSILVRPIHPEEEPWFTRLKRPLEQFLLRRLTRRGLGMENSQPLNPQP